MYWIVTYKTNKWIFLNFSFVVFLVYFEFANWYKINVESEHEVSSDVSKIFSCKKYRFWPFCLIKIFLVTYIYIYNNEREEYKPYAVKEKYSEKACKTIFNIMTNFMLSWLSLYDFSPQIDLSYFSKKS